MATPTNPSQVRWVNRGFSPLFARADWINGVGLRALSFESGAWGTAFTKFREKNTLPGFPSGQPEVRLYRGAASYGNFTETITAWPSTACTFWYYVREGTAGGASSPVDQAIIRNGTTATNLLAWQWQDWDGTVTIFTNNAGAGNAEAGIERVPGSRHWYLTWGRVRGGITVGNNITLYVSSGGIFFSGDEIYTHSPGAFPGYINPISELPHNPRPW